MAIVKEGLENCKLVTVEEHNKIHGIKEPKIVYIIMSPGGGISLSFKGIGTVYSNLEKAEKELESTNEWSKGKGYGVYYLIPLEVK